jgi:hypothetical protein
MEEVKTPVGEDDPAIAGWPESSLAIFSDGLGDLLVRANLAK